MFWDIFSKLCDLHHCTPSFVTKNLGLSNSITTKWKKTNATPNGEILSKIADYFGVTTDYLLGREEKNNNTAWDNAQFAMSAPEGYDALTEEGKRQIQELIKILPKKEGV